MITDPIQTSKAWLCWQAPLNVDVSRDRRKVGEIVASGDERIDFRYLIDEPDFHLAQRDGFAGYPGLPLDRNGHPDALDILARRLPPRSRADFPDFMRQFGLSPEAEFSTLSLLAYTGARLTRDSYGVVESFEGYNRPFAFIFDLAGVRHYLSALKEARPGDSVTFEHDKSNQYDPNAMRAVDGAGRCLGYINRLQSAAARHWRAQGAISGRVMRINGRLDYPRLFVEAQVAPSMSQNVLPEAALA